MPLVAILLYFGAYLFPAVYLVSTRARGKSAKKMAYGSAIHTFWNLAVFGFVFYSWKAGYSEYYWGWSLLYVVNFVSVVYYVGVLLFDHRPSRDPKV